MAEAAVAAAGSIIKGVGGYETGKFNRDLANTEAINDQRAGAAAESRIRDAASMQIGQQVAAQGANGFQQGTGSAIDALTQSQINATMDALNARSEAASRAQAAQVKGAEAYAAGKNALVQGLIGAGSTAISYNSDWASARAGQTASSGYNGGATARTASAGSGPLYEGP